VSAGLEGPDLTDLGGRDWTELASNAKREEQAENELLRELLTFSLSNVGYAIPVERIREIVRVKEITPVPRVPAAVLGVIELRGEIVQVVDLRMRLDLHCADLTRKSRIVVLHGDDERVSGVLVDGVDEVLRAPEENIRPALGGTGFVSDICVRGDEFVSIIDLERALDLDGK